MLNLALLGAKISQREQLLRQASLWLAPVRTGSLVSLASRTMPITFSRSTTTTFLDKDGLLKTAGINVPVIEYDANGNCLGLRVWGATQNLTAYSDQFDNTAAWFDNGTRAQPNTVISPDGTQNADTLTTPNFIYQVVPVTASTIYTGSCFVRLGTMSAADYKVAVYNQTTGSFLAVDIVVEQTPTSSGWTRISYQFTTPVGCTSIRWYPFRNSSAATGTTVHLYGSQVNPGPLAPYVPTTTLAASSTADVMTITGADAARIINGTQFTVYMDGYRTFTGNFPDYPNFYAISDGSSSNSCASYGAQDSQSVTNYSITSNSALQTDFVGVNLSNQQSMKIVQALSANDSRFGVNGTLTAADTSVAMPVGLNKISIGSDAVNGNPGNFYIREFAIFRNSLPSRSLALLMQ